MYDWNSDAVVVDALDQVLDRGNGALAGLVFGPDPFDPLQLSHLVLENYVQGSTSPSPIASDAWCPLAMFADPLDPSTVRIATAEQEHVLQPASGELTSASSSVFQTIFGGDCTADHPWSSAPLVFVE